MNIKERLESPPSELTPTDRKLVRILLNNFPTSGLKTIAQLAKKAGVSDPSVLRFIKKIGFTRYSDFQSALVKQLDERLKSPLLMYSKSGGTDNNPWQRTTESTMGAVAGSEPLVIKQDIEQLAEWLSEKNKKVMCFGGRFSGFLAGYLHAHLQILRPNTKCITSSLELSDTLLDLKPGDIFIQFDYRRYQQSAAVAVEMAHRKKAKVVLFTDIYDSPLRNKADLTISSLVDTSSPFDTLVPAMVQVEALVASLTDTLGDSVKDRLIEVDEMRELLGTHYFSNNQQEQ
ncbi:MAG: MurR/RpiR family transcriptional regulator [Marinomonas sp.]